ncbi:hypothetical protein BGW42_004520 [Actinomortierella wolfii]|nr:hypothetical protein BGW42_004520 [Actinomortierella wolfii]
MINGIQVWLRLHESGLYHQAFLLGTSMLDRLVGNIIFTAQGPDAVIPFIMRELLATPCLVTILGLDMLRILWTLVGSPLTLNLRNLSWHGFILPCDGVPMDAYSTMLIIVFMTILEILRKQSFSLILRPSSEYYQPSENAKRTKDDFAIRYDHLWRPSENKLSEVLNTEGIGMYIRDLCQYSELVTPGSLKQWREACEHILQFRWPPDNNQSVSSDQGHCNDASLLFVMATLPLVEHGLRRIYVRLNKCKPDREHALVGGEYYVTLDVILDALVPEEFFNKQHPASEMKCGKNGVRGQPNRLLEALGPERVRTAATRSR